MKIALVIDDSLDPNDGVQQYVMTVGGWLSRNGHEVHYVTSSTTRHLPHLHVLSKNMRVGFNKNKLGIPLPASTDAIKKLLVQESFDVVHVQMPNSPLMSGRLLSRLPLSAAVVGTFHVAPFSKLQIIGGTVLHKMLRKTLSRFDEVMSVSTVAQDYCRKVFKTRSNVVPNAVDIRHFRSNSKPQPGRIVFLGRLVERKGCMELLKVASQLHKNNIDFELLVLGDGPEREKLEAYVKINDLEGTVTFKGLVSEAEKRDMLATAHLAVFPALGGESFGIVLIEAMASGSQVVLAANNPGYTTVMQDVPESLLSIQDVKRTAAYLATLLQDETKCREIHLKQRNLVKKFDIEVVGKQILAVYNMAIEKRRAKVHNTQ